MTKKNKKVVKKTAKKIVNKVSRKHVSPPPQQAAMAIIPFEEIQKPEMHKGKYNLVRTKLNTEQIKAIIAPTPKHIVKRRPGKGGGNWDYIPGWWFKKKLNFVFGFDGWNTEIDGERIDGNFITVKGRLIITNTQTGKPMISKSDYGGAEIKFKRGTKEYLDISNDFKAAQTDLIKRCAVQLGLAMDVYGKSESQDAGQVVDMPPSPSQPIPQNYNQESRYVEAEIVEPDITCWHDGEPVTQAEAEFSKRLYKVPLCRKCQKLAKDGVITIKK